MALRNDSDIAGTSQNIEESGQTANLRDLRNGKSLSKRAAARQRIEQYYFQVTEGCGRDNCINPLCASAPGGIKFTGNEAAVKALELYKSKAQLCELNPSKVARTDINRKHQHLNKDVTVTEMETESTNTFDVTDSMLPDASNTSSKVSTSIAEESVNEQLQNISVSHSNKEKQPQAEKVLPEVKVKEIPYMTEDIVTDLLKSCTEDNPDKPDYTPFIRLIGRVFSSAESLCRSFLKQKKKDASMNLSKMEVTGNINRTDDIASTSEIKPNEQEKSMQIVNFDHQYEKSVNSSGEKTEESIEPTVDIDAVRRVFEKFSNIECIQNAIVNSLLVMSTSLKFDIKRNSKCYKSNPHFLNIFITVMENTSLHSPEYLEESFPAFCMAMAALPLEAQVILVKTWANYEPQHIKRMVEVLQQLITFKVVCNEGNELSTVNEEENVIAATKCLRIFYYASILGGELDREQDLNGAVPSRIPENPDDALIKDPLAELLGISPVDSVKSLIPLKDFINESLDDNCEVAQDYMYSKSSPDDEQYFSFFGYPFIFHTSTKTTYLFYDNKVRMTSERRLAMISNFMLNMMHVPYLKLKVRRDHVVEDALLVLDITVMDSPEDLRKQLYVEFEGEQGVDEGGVSKEFFQLVVEKLFDPVYGMFNLDENTNLFWFNHTGYFESYAEFKLIGIVLGLAIYNNCILNIRFPQVVYKKLMGKKARFEDMAESHPALYLGLRNLLEHEGDVEEDYLTFFSVGYKDVFGAVQTHDLKENGSNIPVTNDNREEYVRLYADWLLNESVKKQFGEFRRGFELVVRDSPIKHLFLPNEIELIICGSESYDFNELESTTEYDGGFSETSQTIIDFWSIVHEMESGEQKNLLQFTTGTDRAPVGGLSKIKMIIAKNGPDSDRLPTAHTCFNVLLLPDYKNRDKLKERLLKAIKYSHGFGML